MILIENPQYDCHEIGTKYLAFQQVLLVECLLHSDASVMLLADNNALAFSLCIMPRTLLSASSCSIPCAALDHTEWALIVIIVLTVDTKVFK